MGSCRVPAWKQGFCNHLALFLLCSLGRASRDGGREPEIAPPVQGKEACRNGNGRTGGEAGVESSSPLVPTSATCIKVNVKEMEGYLDQIILFICRVYLRLSQAFPAACCPPPLISEEGEGDLIFFGPLGFCCLGLKDRKRRWAG